MIKCMGLRWTESEENGGDKWFLRRIDENGGYWGYVHRALQKDHRNVVGQLSQEDNARFTELVLQIRRVRSSSGEEPAADCCEGVLIESASSRESEVLLEYKRGDEARFPEAKWFTEIVSILRPHMLRFPEPY